MLYRALLWALLWGLAFTCAGCQRDKPGVQTNGDMSANINNESGKRVALLEKEQVVPHFQKFWTGLRAAQRGGDPLAARLDELVNTGKPHVQKQECFDYWEHVSLRVTPGDPELLMGDLPALKIRSGSCWTLHYDGMMGPGLGAALSPDGTALLVWIVAEG